MSDTQHGLMGLDLAHRKNLRRALVISVLAASGSFIVLLVLTDQVWRAVAYAVVALFAFLVAQAVYFWGAMLLGGTLEAVTQRRDPVPWSLDESLASEVPEHDLDPGLELLGAGILVYRVGEVRPQVCFRQVPLAGVRSVRPFVVARTGYERDCVFQFLLSDEDEATRLDETFTWALTDAPQLVMLPYRLLLRAPEDLAGQRWSLQVRSGVTVVAAFRFVFVDGARPVGPASSKQDDPAGDLARHQRILPGLLDEALKQDALLSTQEIVLEDL